MGKAEPFGIYVHWPFCLAKCPYCDFNSHVRHEGVDEQRFVSALVRELDWFFASTGGREVSSIFFGGGTPSLMSPHAVAQVLDGISARYQVRNDAEVTLEANPTSVEAKNFAGYRSAGVNRVSVGVQSLDDGALKKLGRQHTAAEALEAFRLAAKTFPRVSFDMIYARPGQTVAEWKGELGRALEEQHGHMSLYQLTIEPDTQFEKLYRSGKLHIPDEDASLALYDATQEMTAGAGLAAYEVSNHAYEGHESRHNTLYWQYGEYAGLGPGAHSRISKNDGGRMAIDTVKHPETWAKQVEQEGSGAHEKAQLSPKEQAEEYVMMGLRLSGGIEIERYETLAGESLSDGRIELLEAEGLAIRSGTPARFMTTQKGRRVLNAVTSYLCNG